MGDGDGAVLAVQLAEYINCTVSIVTKSLKDMYVLVFFFYGFFLFVCFMFARPCSMTIFTPKITNRGADVGHVMMAGIFKESLSYHLFYLIIYTV